MKVEAINGVNYRNNFTFGERIKTDNESKNMASSPLGALQKVPVIVLLAMNPATLNSAVPTQPEADDPNHIVMVASESEKAESAYATYPQVESTQQSDAPFGWVSLKRYKIPFIMRGKTPMNEFTMMFATSTLANGDYSKITDVFILRDGQNPSNGPFTPPPKLERLYYHNTGDGKEYYGAYIADPISDKNGNEVAFQRHEIRIDYNTAQNILKLIKGNTKWINDTNILYYETNSPQRQKTIEY